MSDPAFVRASALSRSERMKILWSDPAYKEMQHASRVASANKPERRKQLSEQAKKRNQNWTPEQRAKLSANRKGKGPKGAPIEVVQEKQRAASKAWRQKPENLEKRKAYEKAYSARSDIKERKREAQRLYRMTEKYKAWAKTNREKRREQARKQTAKRRATVGGTIHNRVSRAINSLLRDGKNRRRIFHILGYTPNDLEKHIERQFKKGMTWRKFREGMIHIDHIRPVSSFNIKGFDDPELRACWALSNLRPMWAVDNLKKGSRREVLL